MLKVSYTNKDRPVVCQYYLAAITRLGALPKKFKADRGTENRQSLEETMLSDLVVTVVFNMVNLCQSKELKLGGQS